MTIQRLMLFGVVAPCLFMTALLTGAKVLQAIN
jgi:hypothetical protein